MSVFNLIVFFVVIILLNLAFLFFNEEFIIFISLCFFLFFLVNILRKNVLKYFFFRIEFLYFSFLYLIEINLKFLDKLNKFTLNFLSRFLTIYGSELPFATIVFLQKTISLQLKYNLLFVKIFILRFVFNLNFLYFRNFFFVNVKMLSLYALFSFSNFLTTCFTCKTLFEKF